jgi:hypothetical protein
LSERKREGESERERDREKEREGERDNLRTEKLFLRKWKFSSFQINLIVQTNQPINGTAHI